MNKKFAFKIILVFIAIALILRFIPRKQVVPQMTPVPTQKVVDEPKTWPCDLKDCKG